MNRLKLGAAILILFALGALFGALATKVYVKGRISNFVHGMRPPLTIILKGFLAELDLSESQHEEIENILNQSESRFREFLQEHHSEFETLLDNTIIQIEEQLDSGQRKKLDEFYKTFKQRGRMRPGPRGMFKKERPEEVLSDISRRLNLTAEQEREVGPIIESSFDERHNMLEQHRKDLQQRFHAFMEEIEAHRASVEERLSTILTPDQMTAYREFNAQHRPPMRHGPPGGLHGPPDMHGPPGKDGPPRDGWPPHMGPP